MKTWISDKFLSLSPYITITKHVAMKDLTQTDYMQSLISRKKYKQRKIKGLQREQVRMKLLKKSEKEVTMTRLHKKVINI